MRFLNFVNVFYCILLFRNNLPLEIGGPFICRNLNSIHPKILCAKFGWNWPNGSKEEDFKILSEYFGYFIISPLRKGRGPSLKKTLNTLFPKILCAKFVEIWPGGLGEDFLKLCQLMYFLYFVIISTWKRAGPAFEQTWVLNTQVFDLNWPSCSW